MHDDLKEFKRDRLAEDHEGGEKMPCGCELGGWVVMNADAERGLLGQVPDGTFLRPVDADVAGFVLTPEAVAELAILLTAAAHPGEKLDDGAAARQTREERADKAAEGRGPGRVEGVDRG